ncbi:hypothetical protein LTS15_006397 [Exophiala xenobiotica]|nr:hypothetical protein LTS15_006397 [Exophiala xenobiotica]
MLCKKLKTDQALYQAGSLLRMLWNISRASSFGTKIDRVEVHADVVTFWETCIGLCTGPFPHHLFADGKVKQAVLDTSACGDALFNMRKLVHDILSNVCSDFDEVSVMVKNPPWITKCLNRKSTSEEYKDPLPMSVLKSQYVDGAPASRNHPEYSHDIEAEYSHLIFRAKLTQTGEVFSIDLANGQYGHFDTVIPMEKYLSERVENVLQVNPFGTYDETIGAVNEANSRYFDRVQFNALRVDSLLQAWLREQNLMSKSLISLSKSPFKDKLAQLHDYASAGLAATAETSIQCGNLLARFVYARDSKEEAEVLRRRKNLLKVAGITVDMMQQQTRSWFRC